ncbi:voltage-dependent calcium channel gamma-7 subunit-like [Macrosteles quadrilineatus]|uniref:voltage-dependent calcium channel gamma-7 subunit-like n=1 Tax=Macrosteles quadrilineatus TaxID=74068 RepID=UPI0023E0F1CD|nr:voltage-dependent calcium channel gamma-7 subunit-like [Macrosteles quadrilineatus]
MCCGGTPVSRLGLAAGMLSFFSIISAVMTNSWLYAREPLSLPGSKTKHFVSFKIGLWRVCPALKRILTSSNTLLPIPGCQLITYAGWREVREADLGITWSSLEYTPTFITKMRYATPMVALAAAMLGLATLMAVLGHCHNDFRTLLASGLYIIGGLVLAGGLVVYVSVLSDMVNPEFQHRYGRSFHAAIASCVLSQAAGVLSVFAFLGRFPSGEVMVRAVVPGADRQMRKVYTIPCERKLRNTGDFCVVKGTSEDNTCRPGHTCTPSVTPYKPPHRPLTDPPIRYSNILHQGLLGVAQDSSSSGSTPSHRSACTRKFNSLPRPPKFPRIEDPLESFSFPRRTVSPLDSVSSGSLNT